MDISYYESQLEGCGMKEELNSIVSMSYEDEDLSEEDIQNIKDYAQEIYNEFRIADFKQEEAEMHGEDYLTDDELGLTQI